MSEIGDEIFETGDVVLANTAAKAQDSTGQYMYCQPRYDIDRHVYVLIKTRPRGGK